MNDYRQRLRRVGWVPIAIGVLDIGVMAYCIANQLNYSSSFNIFAFIAGAVLVATLSIQMPLMMRGDDAQEAMRRAQEQYGSDYKYFVSRINWSGAHVRVWLTAYNAHEAKLVQIAWEKE